MARLSGQARARGRAAGADEYITKPFSPQDLFLLVSSLLPTSASARAAL
ncbi:MAG TPA: hypothetical protein VII51_10230 [Gaiellaceae bacterium]